MQQHIHLEMNRIVEQYFHVDDLKQLLRDSIAEKAAERSIWSEITYHTHRMLGGNSPFIDQIAAMTEMIILSLDIMDDLQDRDNPDKLWMKCPPEFALNAVLSFITCAISELGTLQQLHPEETFPPIGELSRIITKSINGQQLDLNHSVTTEEDYIRMIQEKSGSLLQMACFMGYSMLPSCPPLTIEVINELANCMGIMAQIQNDVKDLLRYDLKNDLLHKKRTLPILFLLSNDEDSFPVIKQFYDGALTSAEFLLKKRECLEYIAESGCVEYANVIQSLYHNRAEELLDSITTLSPWKENFKEISFASLS